MEENTNNNNGSLVNLNERQKNIASLVDQSGTVRVSDLSREFKVSEETIRRDFERLEKRKLIKKIHGGAVRVEKGIEVPFPKRQSKHILEKEMIANTAASYVEDGDIIAIDASSTSVLMTKYIKGKSLTVITNSIGVTLELAHEQDIRLILIGGYLSESSMSLVGNFAERVVQDYHVDKFFFSCLGVDLTRGVSEIHEDQALVKKQILSISDQLFLLVDHSKFGEKSLFRLCDLSIIDYLITDNKVSINTINELNKKGTRTIVGEKSN
ncbi:DeoR/GlpR family DNA-binding transcription regulator [Halobacillus seohaensis]|uniref:DeoR/GlpR family DNA-binding transcription regulator n=1 Tax=Halobacillus seohaensis TaxID=447421 RepID=A0ABW2EMP8_9BACI